EEVARHLSDGDILLDYSGGTGILLDRLKLRIFDAPIGMLIVDSSPKFLRVALEKFRDDRRVALRLLRFSKEERRLQRLNEVLGPTERMAAHAAFRDRVFLEPRPLEFYLEALQAGGLAVEAVRERTIQASVEEWFQFLSAYHDAVLGWIGGTEKIDGQPPTDE